MKTFTNLLSTLQIEMQEQGQTGTWNTYMATARSMLTFAANKQITLQEVFNRAFLHRYQIYLLNRGCCYNTISAYMRVLRAMANKAEKWNLIKLETGLFDHVYTGSEPTEKRAIPTEAVLKIGRADLKKYPHLKASRDLFMLSFHLQGISFVDLAYLRKADLKGNFITYHRRKTGSRISVEVLEPAQDILEQYLNTDKESPYLLTILTETGEKVTTQYKSTLRKFNRHLKTLAEILGMEENLTSYVARHSWATAAYHIGVPTTIIGAAMGHKTEEVTRVYLAAFNTETLTYANRMVMEELFGKKEMSNKRKIWKNNTTKRGEKNVSFLIRERHQI